MLGPVDYAIWSLSFVLEVCVVVCVLRAKSFLSYFSLSFYMLIAALVNVGQYVVLSKHGYSSLEYRYFYHYSDSLLTVVLYFAIMCLYQHAFREMRVSRYIHVATVLILSGTAWFSYMMIHSNKEHLTSRFVVELGQNLYFVGVLLIYLLWVAILKLRETRARLVHLVLALGIYFSAHAAVYALRNLFPEMSTLLRWGPPLIGTFLPLAWAYTFTMIPEEARLSPARLARAHR